MIAEADLDGVADDGDLDLAAPILGADPVVGAGEAHVARRVDLVGHRRRGHRPRCGRQPATPGLPARCDALGLSCLAERTDLEVPMNPVGLSVTLSTTRAKILMLLTATG